MRKLAIFSAAFSVAVCFFCWLLPSTALPICALAATLVWVGLHRVRTRKIHSAVAASIVCMGLSVGFLWCYGYQALMLAPARELDGQTIVLQGVVVDWPVERNGGYSVTVRADRALGVPGKIRLYTDEQGRDLQPGDQISTIAGCISGERKVTGEAISYYTAQGIFVQAKAYGRLSIQSPERVSIRFWPIKMAAALKRGVDAVFPEELAPFVKALVTGDRQDLSDEFQTDLRRTGLSHVVAVSGMHLAFLAGVLDLFLGRGRRSTTLLMCVTICVFCAMVGNTPSVVRAAVMIIMLHLAPLLQRERDDPTALMFALMLLLAWNPLSVAHVGLQLSFAAVAGIMLVSERIRNRLLSLLRLDRKGASKTVYMLLAIPRFGVGVFATTLGASLLTVPLIAFQFQTLSLIAPIANLAALWAVSLLFLGGLLAGVLGIFWPIVGAIVSAPFLPVAHYFLWVVKQLSGLPYASLPMDTGVYRLWLVLVYGLILLTVFQREKRPILLPVAAAVGTLLCSIGLSVWLYQSGDFVLTVLDVGQGQSVLLRMGQSFVLVDCGGSRSENAGDLAADYLQTHGGKKLDVLVLSHCHADHANGVVRLLDRIEVGTIVLPDRDRDMPLRQEIERQAAERDIPMRHLQYSLNFHFGGERNLTIYPPMGRGDNPNKHGLTVLASVGENEVLMTGDMNCDTEKRLLRQVELPDVEVMLAGHHGSGDSNSMELLEHVTPEVVVVSVGQNNPHKHPAEEALTRFEAVGAEVYRTDVHGTITVQVGEK